MNLQKKLLTREENIDTVRPIIKLEIMPGFMCYHDPESHPSTLL